MGATEVNRMKPFITIARPHKDILEGRLTEDVFAAEDLSLESSPSDMSG